MFIDTTDTLIKAVVNTEHVTRILRITFHNYVCSYKFSSSGSQPWCHSNPIPHSQMHYPAPINSRSTSFLPLSLIRCFATHKFCCFRAQECPSILLSVLYSVLSFLDTSTHSQTTLSVSFSWKPEKVYEVKGLEGCQAARGYGVLLQYHKKMVVIWRIVNAA